MNEIKFTFNDMKNIVRNSGLNNNFAYQLDNTAVELNLLPCTTIDYIYTNDAKLKENFEASVSKPLKSYEINKLLMNYATKVHNYYEFRNFDKISTPVKEKYNAVLAYENELASTLGDDSEMEIDTNTTPLGENFECIRTSVIYPFSPNKNTANYIFRNLDTEPHTYYFEESDIEFELEPESTINLIDILDYNSPNLRKKGLSDLFLDDTKLEEPDYIDNIFNNLIKNCNLIIESLDYSRDYER